MATVLHEMVGLERMLDYRGVGLQRYHCTLEPLSEVHIYMYYVQTSFPALFDFSLV